MDQATFDHQWDTISKDDERCVLKANMHGRLVVICMYPACFTRRWQR